MRLKNLAACSLALAMAGACSSAKSFVDPVTELQFVHLAGGSFHEGCEPGDSQCPVDEKPGKPVTVNPFWIAKTDVTVAAYAKCVAAGTCSAPNLGAFCNWQVPGKERHPVNCIDWNQATAFCQWIGGRLPTPDEWEFAAKGGESRVYPWASGAPNTKTACFKETCGHGTTPADSYAGGASKDGLLNMAGNVWQWTASNDDPRVKRVRGGSWFDVPAELRASRSIKYDATTRFDIIGVRCAK